MGRIKSSWGKLNDALVLLDQLNCLPFSSYSLKAKMEVHEKDAGKLEI